MLEHALVTEAEARTLPFRHGCKTVVQFARHLLHISPGEAAGRVRAAERLGARHNPHTGQQLGAECHTVHGGKITEMWIIFDRLPFAAARKAAP